MWPRKAITLTNNSQTPCVHRFETILKLDIIPILNAFVILVYHIHTHMYIHICTCIYTYICTIVIYVYTYTSVCIKPAQKVSRHVI